MKGRIVSIREKQGESVSLITKAGNLGAALVEWGAGGFAMASEETRLKRRAICEQCPQGRWNPSGNLGLGECMHPKCGCSKLKWFLATSRCPLKLW
jgi:hypothetical protein